MTAKQKRPTYEDYPEWLASKLGAGIGAKEETHYRISSQLIQQQTLQSEFWLALADELPDAESEYLVQKGFPLYANTQQKPDLVRKDWESFKLKTYRKNIRDNPKWPREPSGGWVLFPSWYSQVGDIVRTLIVVKYLDGLEFLAQRISEVAETHGLRVKQEKVARDEGYYATHVDVLGTVTLPGVDWDEIDVEVSVEIQVTTQLQDNIRQLLHFSYEAARSASTPKDWKWDYRSPEFSANYLGHVLHYLEGKVMAAREAHDASSESR